MEIIPAEPASNRREPRAITIGDLAALTTGLALALALPTRDGYWPISWDTSGPWTPWLPCFALRQHLGVACLALALVVFWRRAIYGGLARPAEFLVLCAAMPILVEPIEVALIRLSIRLQTGARPSGVGLNGLRFALINEWHDTSHWVWEQALLTTGLVALALVYLLRRQRRDVPGSLLSALLILAWLAAYQPVPEMVRHWFFPIIDRVTGRSLGQAARMVISAALFHLPRAVLYSVPAIAALRDIRRAGRSRPTWLEWTSLGLASAFYFASEFSELVPYFYLSTASAGTWALEPLIRAVVLLAALVLGLLLTRSRRAGPR